MKYISLQFKELNEQKKAKYSRKLEKEVKKYSEKLVKFKAVCYFVNHYNICFCFQIFANLPEAYGTL